MILTVTTENEDDVRELNFKTNNDGKSYKSMYKYKFLNKRKPLLLYKKLLFPPLNIHHGRKVLVMPLLGIPSKY